jgi:hypothetical protein
MTVPYNYVFQFIFSKTVQSKKVGATLSEGDYYTVLEELGKGGEEMAENGK